MNFVRVFFRIGINFRSKLLRIFILLGSSFIFIFVFFEVSEGVSLLLCCAIYVQRIFIYLEQCWVEEWLVFM